MSELMKDLNASVRTRNAVELALAELELSDQRAFMEALRGGGVSQVDLARILTKHSGIHVKHKQLSEYKRKAA